MNFEKITVVSMMVFWAIVALWMTTFPDSLVKNATRGGVVLRRRGLMAVRAFGLVNLLGVIHLLIYGTW